MEDFNWEKGAFKSPLSESAVKVLEKLRTFIESLPNPQHILERHKILLLVHAALTQHVTEPNQHSISIDHTSAQRLLLQTMQQCFVLGQVTAMLQAAAIPFLVLKGRAYEPLFYPQGVYRQASDIDLLVSPKDFLKALATLSGKAQDKDFTAKHTYARTIVINTVEIDLHQEIQESYFSNYFTWEELWEQHQDMHTSYATFSMPNKEHLFLMMILHGAKHQWARLQWILDLAFFIITEPPYQIAVYLDAAETRGLGSCAATALLLVKEFLPEAFQETAVFASQEYPTAHALATSFHADLVRERHGFIEKIKNRIRYARLLGSNKSATRYLVGYLAWSLQKNTHSFLPLDKTKK